jgi:biopolymer transport protein ExbD
MNKRRNQLVDADEVPMAPMIDMVFLLIVFFMTVGTMIRDARPPLDLAESAAAARPADGVAREIVTLLPGAAASPPQLFIGARPVTREALATALASAYTGDPHTVLNLRLAHDAQFRDLQPLLELGGAAGAADIVLAAFRHR